MNYFIRISNKYNPKNRLQAEVQTLAESLNRLFVEEKNIQLVMGNVLTTIEELERKYPRTNPTRAWLDKPRDYEQFKDYEIYVPNVITISFMECKGEVTP